MNIVYYLLKMKSEMRSDLHAAYCPYVKKGLNKTGFGILYFFLVYRSKERIKKAGEQKLLSSDCSYISQTGVHRRFVYILAGRIFSSNWFKRKTLESCKLRNVEMA